MQPAVWVGLPIVVPCLPSARVGTKTGWQVTVKGMQSGEGWEGCRQGLVRMSRYSESYRKMSVRKKAVVRVS